MINIISRDNQYGLTKDIDILKKLITSPYRIVPFNQRNIPQADINLFVELFDPRFLDHAKLNYIIPNQEWFMDPWKKYIKDFDLILCKTKYAQAMFSPHNPKCEYISFTIPDRDWETDVV